MSYKDENNINKRVKVSDIKLFKRLISYTKPHSLAFALILILMIVVIVMQMLMPLLSGTIIDVILGNKDADSIFSSVVKLVNQEDIMSLIIILSVFYMLFLLISELVNFLQQLLLQKTAYKITNRIRIDVYKHLNTLPISFFNEYPVGALVTRVTNDTATLYEMYTSVLINLIRNVITLIVIFIMMMLINVQLALITAIFIPITLLISFVFKRFSRRAFRRVRTNVAVINTFLSEHLGGMKIIQMFNLEKKKEKEFRRKNDTLRKSYYSQMLTFSIFRPLMYLVFMVAVIVILWFGGNSVLKGTITLGAVFAFYRYLTKFFTPIQELADQFNTLQSAFASSEKIFALMNEKNNIVERPNPIFISDVKGEIVFENVWFAYDDKDWILKDISFKINAKESVAFVGATGAGKTTILKLITRDYDINRGRILIDGIDIKDISISNLRSHIGKMMQDVFLFSDTIANNISLNNPKITEKDVQESIRYVGADTFIEKLPNKYHEYVLERGNNFSVGERQLLSFARTIAHKPSVILLDEATANIDTETENIIQENLYKVMNSGTMLIIAHRLSTITHVDKIILLDKGEIKEEGNHKELLQHKGLYYNLYKTQYEEGTKEERC